MRHPVSRPLAVVLLAISLVMTALVLTGCVRDRIDPAQAEVVRAYTRGLTSTLSATTLDGIRPYATPRELGRMRLYVVMLLEERNQRVQARLLSQEIQSTETLGEDRARVVAAERWSMTYTDRDSGAVVSRDEYASQATYELVRIDGNWFVDQVSTP